MKKLSKRKKIVAWITGIILLLALIIIIGADMFVSNFIKNKIETEVNQNPDIPYTLEVESIIAEPFTGSLRLKKINFSPKQFATDSLEADKMGSLYKGRIDLIKVTNVHILSFISDKELIISKFTVKGASVMIFKNSKVEKPERLDQDSAKVNKNNIFKSFKELKIRKISLEDINLSEFNVEKPLDTLLNVRSLHITINDVLFNEKTINGAIPVFFDGLTVGVKHFSGSGMKFYGITTSGVKINMNDTIIVVNDFGFIPKYGRAEYNRRLKYENDLFTIKTKRIVLNGLSVEELLDFKDGLGLSSVEVEGLDADIYRDKNLPDPPYKYHPLLAGLIRKIPIQFTVDSLLIKNAKLAYSEKQKYTETPGVVNFSKLNIVIHNITNSPGKLSENHFMPIYINSKLYGKGDMKARLDIDLSSQREDFTAMGSLGKIKAAEFNKMTKELILAEITSGEIMGAYFTFSADDDVSNGELIVNYKNLKVKILKTGDTTRKAKFMSFFAGTALRGNNMPDNKKYRKGIIHFERVKGKALPNYLWKSVMSGLISTIAPIGQNKTQKQKSKANRKSDRSDNKDAKKSNKTPKNKKKKNKRKG